jgi:hypothetical protein
MKQFLIKLVIFAVLFFVLEKVLWFVIEDASVRTYDKRLEKIINGEINKDIIILGSSRGARNILAGEIEKKTGLKTYNLSYLGSDIHFHMYMLKTLLKNNITPKKIILSTDGKFQFANDSSLVFRYDKLNPLVKYNSILKKLQTDNKKSKASSCFYALRVQLSQFNFKTQKASKLNTLDSFGSKPYLYKNSLKNKKSLNFDETNLIYNKNTENLLKVEVFIKFQELCIENNIELICVINPGFRTYDYSFTKRFKKTLKKETRLFIYDTLNPVYKSINSFHDESHLSFEGAKVLTDEIINFVKKESN